MGSEGRRESEELKENEGIGRGSRVCHTCCSALHRIYTVLFVFNESYNHRLFPTFGCVCYIMMGR